MDRHSAESSEQPSGAALLDGPSDHAPRGLDPSALSIPPARRALRWIELLVFFFLGPVAGAMLFHPRHVLWVLAGLTVVCLAVLWIDPRFDRGQFWNARGARRVLGMILGRFVVSIIGVTALVLLFIPERFLSFPRERPAVWAIVMTFYPVFSVYPQELVWRVFFHHRYRPLFPSTWAMIVASAAAFGVMHVVFQNWVAVAMTVVGGAYFAHTYERSRSAAAVWIEHALYGCAVFTVGLGIYFYGGAVR